MKNTQVNVNLKRLKKRALITRIIIVVLVIFNIVLGLGVYGAKQIKPIKEQARVLKEDVKSVMSAISQNEPKTARVLSEQMVEDSTTLRETVSTPYWKAVACLPVVGKQLKSAIKLTEILEVADEGIILPVIDTIEEHPTDSIMVEGTINGEALKAYVELIQGITPVMNNLSAQMEDIDVSLIDSDGKITTYITAFRQFTDVLNQASNHLITPLAEQLAKYPTDAIKTETGFNNEALRSYLIFIENILPEVQYIADYIDGIDFSAVDSEGKIKDYTTDVSTLVMFLDEASVKVIRPLIDQLEICPLDNIKADGGFDVMVVNNYLYFIEDVMPGFKDVSAKMDSLTFARLDANGKITEYQEKLNHIIETYDAGEQYIELIHTILGDGSDKFYFIGTQNSAEIRASGGFPGSVGSLVIENGILKIGEFSKVYSNFYYRMPAGANVTDLERNLFSGMPYPWDADFCPDFERVGEIWALAYEDRNGIHVDGVISMTPSIIQELLKFLGEIELSDGTILDGENATAFLQNGVYVKYQNTYSEEFEGNEFVDSLFAETAKKTMDLLVDEFKVGYMPEFLSVLQTGIEDRTIMFWFDDDEEQEVARRTGSNGGLNRDESHPAAGVYFSLANACKMGWYLDIDIACSDGVENEDGSYSYDVEVRFTNIMTPQEAASVSGYITSTGYMSCLIYLFAPAGGTVSGFKTDAWSAVQTREYSGLQLGYLGTGLNPGKTITVNYTVTTAPGEQELLEFSVTPTMTQYRE